LSNDEGGEGEILSFPFLGGLFEELTEDYLKQTGIRYGIKAASKDFARRIPRGIESLGNAYCD
jgi:hypothetical protein